MSNKTLLALTVIIFAMSLFTSWGYISKYGFDDAWSILAVFNPIILIVAMFMIVRGKK